MGSRLPALALASPGGGRKAVARGARGSAMKSLNIAVTVDPYIPVPPLKYGGIERVVEFVVNGLVERGHAVTLYAHPESHCKAKLVPYGVPPHFSKWARLQ